MSIFSKVFGKNKSQRYFKIDLSIKSESAFQWKIQFNPDPNKQANEVFFPRKCNTENYSSIVNEAIMTISHLLIYFFTKSFERTERQIKQKPTNKTKLSKH